MKTISFVIPSRNNLKYLQWSYNSIRKNLGYTHEIMFADDFSSDGTWEWLQKIKEKDINVQIFKNKGPERKGIVYWYDFLCEKSTSEIVMFFHADMYACPKLDEEILKHLEPGKVVTATRIEPPLHPDGPEKILEDFGIEPEEFKEQELLNFVDEVQSGNGLLYGPLALNRETSNGIFAPWAMYKKDFLAIGGHDPLYAPQSKEDSDIFNRFVLAEYELVQTWKGFVYHMTCRGSRFADGAKRNPDGQVFMKNRETNEWLKQNQRSTRNFIRKWGHFVKHDDMMMPIIPPKYDIGFVVENCGIKELEALEPWCSDVYGDWVGHKGFHVNKYIEDEQPNTDFNLSIKLHSDWIEPQNDVVVYIDCSKLNNQNFQMLTQLSEILEQQGEVGEFELDEFTVNVKALHTYEKELIVCKTK